VSELPTSPEHHPFSLTLEGAAQTTLTLGVMPEKIARRLEDFQSPPVPARGYKALYRRTLTQAPEGCDFNLLVEPPRHD